MSTNAPTSDVPFPRDRSAGVKTPPGASSPGTDGFGTPASGTPRPGTGAPGSEFDLGSMLGPETQDGVHASAPRGTSEVPAEGPGSVLGRYRILQVLGEGGFGVVYLAEQKTPVERRVAVKVLKPGMDSREVLARFEAERQALAMMDHPSIAQFFDAGETPSGRPFFVIEHIPGVAINEYCDRRRLSTRERLELFIPVCRAVQHAHQKGVIHRDLKPGNILVAEQDGRPLPKVIDFGVAKAVSRPLTDRTLFTETGRMIGTPEYMSPEQAGTTGLDVDTRTDVYSLGVILYELLVGALPFDSRTLRMAGYDGIMRIIREQDPPSLSGKLSSLGEALSTSAEKRGAAPRELEALLRGDLEWIAARAMEKDRARRYASASEFAQDIERHLRNEPVLARPASAAYRAAKFYRRHRVAVLASAAVAVAVVAGAAAATAGMVSARAARADAEKDRDAARAAQGAADKAKEGEAAARRKAEAERDRAAALNEFLGEIIVAADPASLNRAGVTAEVVLDRAAAKAAAKFKDDPATEALYRGIVGRTYSGMGSFDKAEPHLVRALELRRAAAGAVAAPAEAAEDLASSLNDLGQLRHRQGKPAEAVALLSEARDAAAKLPSAARLAAAVSSNLAAAKFDAGDDAGGLEEVQRAEAAYAALLGPNDPNTLNAKGVRAAMLMQTDRGDEAERLLREILAAHAAAAVRDRPSEASVLTNLAELLRQRGRFAEAEPLLREALAIQKDVFGEAHPEVQTTLANFGLVLQGRNDLAGAETMFRAALEIARKVGLNGRPDLDIDVINLANLLLDKQGASPEAERLADEAAGFSAARRAADDPVRGFSLLVSGRVLLVKGDAAGAEVPLRAAVDLWEKAGMPGWAPAQARSLLGEAMLAQRRNAEARVLLEPAHDALLKVLGPDHRRTKEARARLERLYTEVGDDAALEKLRGK